MPTILAVAISENSMSFDLNADPRTTPPPDTVRPYIYGVIDALEITIGTIGTHYTIKYRECPWSDLDDDAFGDFTAGWVTFCMSARVLDHAKAKAAIRPIVGVVSNINPYRADPQIFGYVPNRVQTTLACYNHFLTSVPSVTTVYVLHDKDHGPSNAALNSLPAAVRRNTINVSKDVPPNEIAGALTTAWADVPNKQSSGILVLPVDRCFGDAFDINLWGYKHNVPIFWPATDWVFSATTPEQPSAIGGYGVPQYDCGRVMGQQIATLLAGGTPIQKWVYANINDPTADPTSDIYWAVSKAAAAQANATLVNPPLPQGLHEL